MVMPASASIYLPGLLPPSTQADATTLVSLVAANSSAPPSDVQASTHPVAFTASSDVQCLIARGPMQVVVVSMGEQFKPPRPKPSKAIT